MKIKLFIGILLFAVFPPFVSAQTTNNIPFSELPKNSILTIKEGFYINANKKSTIIFSSVEQKIKSVTFHTTATSNSDRRIKKGQSFKIKRVYSLANYFTIYVKNHKVKYINIELESIYIKEKMTIKEVQAICSKIFILEMPENKVKDF